MSQPNRTSTCGAECRPASRVARMLLACAVASAVALAVAPALATGTASAQTPTQTPTPQAAPLVDPTVTAADLGRITGSPTAKVWMLVVSDFECPFCRQWHDESWEAIRREYVATGKLRVAYVNFPLDIHPNAKPAALAAMCASAQGKFWPVADRLFATQDRWKDLRNPTSFFDDLVKAAGVDLTKERACVNGAAMAALVEADRVRMGRAGTQSTPTFFIGSARIEGAQPLADFRRVIDAELAKHKSDK